MVKNPRRGGGRGGGLYMDDSVDNVFVLKCGMGPNNEARDEQTIGLSILPVPVCAIFII